MSQSIQQNLLRHAAENATAIAVIDSENHWTYGDLSAATVAVWRFLESLEFGEGDVAALLSANSAEYIAVYYGILLSGGTVVALNSLERKETWERQCEHCEASVLFVDESSIRSKNFEVAARVVRIQALKLRETPDRAIPEPAAHGSADSQLDHLASIIYTSGTTGSPKGIMLSHGNLSSNVASVSVSLPIRSTDRCLVVLPFFYSFGNSVMHTHISAGACLVLCDNIAFPQRVLEKVDKYGISSLYGVPLTFSILFEKINLSQFELTSLRYIAQAGGAMPTSQQAHLRELLSNVELYIMYGQTEATARLTCLAASDTTRKAGSVGKPIPGVNLEIRADNGDTCENGQIGEIWASGPNVMLGYWRDEEASRVAIQDGWLHTGDRGYFDRDDFLYIAGRTGDMIKTGANRVFPAEIEEVIERLPEVKEAAAVGIDDPLLGQRIVACIVKVAASDLTAKQVKHECVRSLASYKVPREVCFVSELPRTSSGKLRRREIAEQLDGAEYCD